MIVILRFFFIKYLYIYLDLFRGVNFSRTCQSIREKNIITLKKDNSTCTQSSRALLSEKKD